MKMLGAKLYGCAFACMAVVALGCGGDADSEADLELEEDTPVLEDEAWQMEAERDLELPSPGPIERRRVIAEPIEGHVAVGH